MNIAIVGSGFFGLSLGLILSKKHKVHIYEKEKRILNGASSVNQFRFHLGYHYPRSQKTVNHIKKSKNLFTSFYGKKVLGETKNFYLIAKNGKVDFKKYEKFLKKNKLYYSVIKLFLENRCIEKVIKCNEKILNFFKFKKIILDKIKKSNIEIKFKKQFLKEYLFKYDKVIVSTYSNNNIVLNKLGIKSIKKFEYQLVEKILVELPKKYSDKSYIVIDGKFVNIDPYLSTKYHLLSDAKLSKIETKIGKYPIFKNKNKSHLNKGLIKNIKNSIYKKAIKRCSKYLPFLNEAKYIGSLYVVRVIGVNKSKTDERTAQIYNHSKKIISIFSGKWNNCVYWAKKIDKNISK
jgi:D-amino-acid oxidase